MKAKARAVATAVKNHRVFFLLIMGLFTVGLLAGSYAIQSNASFSGQTREGDHNWWQNVSDQAFCENCHTAIGTDISTGPHAPTAGQTASSASACSFCHTPGDNDHAAGAAACTDCHSNRATELASSTEAHNGILGDLGESTTDASQTCQSCHTHAEVTMAITPAAPIPLQMGG